MRDSTKQWGLSPPSLEYKPLVAYVGNNPVGFAKPTGIGSVHEYVTLAAESTTGKGNEEMLLEEVCLRLMCHVLTNQLPSVAMPELFENLGDMYEFYRDREDFSDIRAFLPNVTLKDAKVIERTTRPVFELSGE